MRGYCLGTFRALIIKQQSSDFWCLSYLFIVIPRISLKINLEHFRKNRGFEIFNLERVLSSNTIKREIK